MPWKEPPPDLAAAGDPSMLFSGSIGTLKSSHASPASSTSQVADLQAPAKRRAQTPATLPLGSDAQVNGSEQHLVSTSPAKDYAESHLSPAAGQARETSPCQGQTPAAQSSQGQGSGFSGSRKRRFGEMDDPKDYGQELHFASSVDWSMQVRSSIKIDAASRGIKCRFSTSAKVAGWSGGAGSPGTGMRRLLIGYCGTEPAPRRHEHAWSPEPQTR